MLDSLCNHYPLTVSISLETVSGASIMIESFPTDRLVHEHYNVSHNNTAVTIQCMRSIGCISSRAVQLVYLSTRAFIPYGRC